MINFNFPETYKILRSNIPHRNFMKFVLLSVDTMGIYLNTYLIVCFQKIIDAVTEVAATGDYTIFKQTVLLTALVVFLNFTITLINPIINFVLEKDFVSNTMNFIFSSFFKQNFFFTKNNTSGEIAYIFDNETTSIAQWLYSGEITILENIINFFIKYGIIFAYSPTVAIIAFLIVVVSFLATDKLNQKIAIINKEVYAASAELMQFYVQSVNSFVDIKQLQKEEDYTTRMLYILRNKVYHRKKSLMLYSLWYDTIFSITSLIFPISVLMGGLYLTINGNWSIGKTIALHTLVNTAQIPFNSLAEDISNWKSMLLLTERLTCFMPPSEDDEKDKKILTDVDNINVDCKSFAYSDESVILKNINFNITKGEVFCIKGHTGVGKTTLGSLLMRFNTLTEPSKIEINGININDYTHKSFYKNINTLNQIPYIFETTLLSNITMDDTHTKEEIDEVIEVAQLNSFVEQYGLDYELNEDANNISGGQKQRIGLARFLLRKPQVLILDEPTAALDQKTSEALVEALIKFKDKYNMTIIVITHSSIFDDVATQILDLDAQKM